MFCTSCTAEIGLVMEYASNHAAYKNSTLVLAAKFFSTRLTRTGKL